MIMEAAGQRGESRSRNGVLNNPHCTENNIRRSLGRTGICYDNAVSESFFATYKKELIHTRPWPTLASLERETSDWLSNYYNRVRRHSTLGYLTPEEYELGYRRSEERRVGKECRSRWAP